MRKEEIRLGRSKVLIKSVEVGCTPPFNEEMLIKMLSPVTVYSTLEKKDGSKKTYFYHPREPEFCELISKNLKKKYRAFYRCEPPKEKFEIKPEKVSSRSLMIVNYKDFVIKGWLGVYRVRSHPELIKLGWDSGIGSKNSQGFGMFEFIIQKPEEVKNES